jgi:hypothetical protein
MYCHGSRGSILVLVVMQRGNLLSLKGQNPVIGMTLGHIDKGIRPMGRIFRPTGENFARDSAVLACGSWRMSSVHLEYGIQALETSE